MGNRSSNSCDDVTDGGSDIVTRGSPLVVKEREATMQLMRELGEHKEQDAVAGTLAIPAIDNSEYPYAYERLELPLDDDGYVQAFTVDQAEDLKAFFDRYGVVVVKDVINAAECSRTEDEIWAFINRHTNGRCVRDDPRTWWSWPALAKLGILGNELILSEQSWHNRQNPNVVKAFQILFGTEQVWVNVGRASAMRPTRDVPWPKADLTEHQRKRLMEARGVSTLDELDAVLAAEEGDTVPVDMPDWKTVASWIHLDMDPWRGGGTCFSWRLRSHAANAGYEQLKVQGILAAVDCDASAGGFHCVPGFQHHIRGWAHASLDRFKAESVQSSGSYPIPKTEPFLEDAQRVTVRAGSLVIWNSCLPHATFPNDSDHGRMIQYIKAQPVSDAATEPLLNQDTWLPPNFELTPLGARVLGFQAWDDDIDAPGAPSDD